MSSSALPVPTKAQQRWQDCELGIIYHFDLPIAAGRFTPSNAVKERLDPALYNPEQLDTDQWIEAAKAMRTPDLSWENIDSNPISHLLSKP